MQYTAVATLISINLKPLKPAKAVASKNGTFPRFSGWKNQSRKTNHFKNQHPRTFGNLVFSYENPPVGAGFICETLPPKKIPAQQIQATQDVILIVRQIPGWTGMVWQTFRLKCFVAFRKVGWWFEVGFPPLKIEENGYKVRPCLVATMMALGKGATSSNNMVIYCIYPKFPGVIGEGRFLRKVGGGVGLRFAWSWWS